MLTNLKPFHIDSVELVPESEFRYSKATFPPYVSVSKHGDYSSSKWDVSLFEVHFFTGGKYVKGIEEYVCSYDIDDDAKKFTVTFNTTDEAYLDADGIFGKFSDTRAVIFRINRTGEFIARRTLDCKVESISEAQEGSFRKKTVVFSFD